jgi:hypothetical protein
LGGFNVMEGLPSGKGGRRTTKSPDQVKGIVGRGEPMGGRGQPHGEKGLREGKDVVESLARRGEGPRRTG